MRLDTFSNLFVWLGVLFGALSSVKAINVWLDFGLGGVWNEILVYYTTITEPFRKLVSRLFTQVPMPFWLPDLLILYSTLVMAGIRATVVPLRNREFRNFYSTKRIFRISVDEVLTEASSMDSIATLGQKYGFTQDQFMSGITKDGRSEIELRDIRPDWQIYCLRILGCLTLYPILSFEPYRKLKISPKLLLKLLKKAKPGDVVVSIDEGKSHSTYTVSWLRAFKLQLDGACQIISLPILVITFLFCGTYWA